MKHKMSITIEEDTVLRILDKLRDPRFKNKSQIIEHAVNQFLKYDQTIPFNK